MKDPVTVVGAGLAGSEAAWQLSIRGVPVRLIEMKPKKMTPAHTSPYFAELVCSNSLRSDELTNAVGLLKEELRRMGSLILRCADGHRVAAGGALAVDRAAFAGAVTEALRARPNVEIVEEEVLRIPDGDVILATGPLTADALAENIAKITGREGLHFFDAAAPIVTLASVDMTNAYFASRYGKGTPDYVNCPLTREEYTAFRRELCSAREAPVHGFDDSGVFEGCMPVEVLARRGEDTLRYGPMKPVGLRDPRTGQESWAVVQLRRDNAEGTLYNLVGFQTHLAFPEQRRVFSMIPALRRAEFVRYGVMHRNTYLDSPRLLDSCYRLREDMRIRFAGQMTGVEGYVESCASGFLAGLALAAERLGIRPPELPRETAVGALGFYVSQGSVGEFQPMNVNFGILAPLDRRVRGKRNKNLEIAARSLKIIDELVKGELWECVSS
jgi:methylenetetrahydrofolate--tRNA-(uracil-5-)-methyltransferase